MLLHGSHEAVHTLAKKAARDQWVCREPWDGAAFDSHPEVPAQIVQVSGQEAQAHGRRAHLTQSAWNLTYVDGPRPTHYSVCPDADLFRRFAARAGVAEHLPAKPLLGDLVRRLASQSP
jgi:hypothetical protein